MYGKALVGGMICSNWSNFGVVLGATIIYQNLQRDMECGGIIITMMMQNEVCMLENTLFARKMGGAYLMTLRTISYC